MKSDLEEVDDLLSYLEDHELSEEERETIKLQESQKWADECLGALSIQPVSPNLNTQLLHTYVEAAKKSKASPKRIDLSEIFKLDKPSCEG